MGEKHNELKELSKDQNDLLKQEKSSGEEFLRSAAYTAVQMPYEGVSQVANKIAGSTILPETEITRPEPAQPGSSRWLAQTAGTAVGALPWFMAIGKGVQLGANPFVTKLEGNAARLAGWKMSSTALATGEAALIGGIYSGVLQPSHDLNNFWADRATNATIGAATLGSFGYGMSKFDLPDSASRLSRMGAATVSGLGAGFVGAESASLLKENRIATASELKTSMMTYGLIATALGAAGRPEALAKPKQIARNAETAYEISENPAQMNARSFNKQLSESHKLIDSGKTTEAASSLELLSNGLKSSSVKNAATADGFMEVGTAFRRLGQEYTPQARSSFQDAMDIYHNGGARAQAADAAHRLSTLEEGAGNYAKAADLLNTSLNMKSDAAGVGLLNRAEMAEFRQTQTKLYDKLEHLYRKAGNNELADKVRESRPLPEAPIDYHRIPKEEKK